VNSAVDNGAGIVHGDPIAPVILGVTSILLFAAIGLTLGVIDDALFSAIALMVMITTLIAPPLLRRVISNDSGTTSAV
jgi:Kef-type K+ transport system membrane component KefB